MLTVLMIDAYRAVCALAAVCYLAPLIAGLKGAFNDLSTLEMRCPHEGL